MQVLHSQFEWGKFIEENKFFPTINELVNLYTRLANQEKNYYCFLIQDSLSSKTLADAELYKRGLHDGQVFFNLDHMFLVLEWNNFYWDYYVFSTYLNNVSIVNFYINELELIRKFISNFKIAAKKYLEPSIILTSPLKIEHGDHLLDAIEKVQPSGLTDYNKHLRKIMPEKFLIGDTTSKNYLSKQEFFCLNKLAHGATAKSIANSIHISHRTVEKHIQNMKDKLGCHTKLQLIDLFHIYQLNKFL